MKQEEKKRGRECRIDVSGVPNTPESRNSLTGKKKEGNSRYIEERGVAMIQKTIGNNKWGKKL